MELFSIYNSLCFFAVEQKLLVWLYHHFKIDSFYLTITNFLSVIEIQFKQYFKKFHEIRITMKFQIKQKDWQFYLC